MTRAPWLLFVLLCGCPPKGPPPEHGTELRFTVDSTQLSLGAGLRTVVERRLASAQLKARVFVDGSDVAVRVPDGGSPSAVAEVLLPRAQLRVCPSPDEGAKALCAVDAGPDVTLVADELGRCHAEATRPSALAAVFGAHDAGFALEHGQPFKGHVRGVDCLALAVEQASALSGALPALRLHLSASVADGLGAFTGARIGQRLLVLLDDEVLMAPIVLEPLRGRTLTVALPGPLGSRAQTLAAVLSGGELPAVSLTSTRAY